MRTTITLDDGLAADLKRRARSEGTSVSAFIAEVLRAQLARREARSKVAPFRLLTVKGGGLRPGIDVTRHRTIEETEDLDRRKRRPRCPLLRVVP